MPTERFFVAKDFIEGASLEVIEEEARHLLQVTRHSKGDRIELVNGQGILAQATLTDVAKKSATLRIDSLKSHPKESASNTLLIALCQPNHLEWIIEKGVEIGATAFLLYPAEKSPRKELSENQKQRLRHLAIAALKQSGRFYLPEIKEIEPIAEWKELPGITYYGSLEEGSLPLSHYKEKGNLFFLVGPESGLSSIECAHLKHLGAIPVTLNPYTLRAETAAIVGLTLLICKSDEKLSG